LRECACEVRVVVVEVLRCWWSEGGGCACWLSEGGFVWGAVEVWRAFPAVRGVCWVGWVLQPLLGGRVGFRLLLRSGGE
jgi:hypothetical protein